MTSISQINRHNKNIKPTIDIINVSRRVKTYCMKHISHFKNPSNDSNNSIVSKNLAVIKSEMIAKQSINVEKVKDEIVEISVVEKVLSDLEDDRLSEDENPNLESIDDVEKEKSIQMIVDEEKITNITEIVNKDVDKTIDETHKDKKLKLDKDGSIDLVEEKRNKFESSTKKNYLDPTHWLKFSLSEEEAEKEFRSRAQDPKYISSDYKCTSCRKGYSTEDILKRHIKLRHCKVRVTLDIFFTLLKLSYLIPQIYLYIDVSYSSSAISLRHLHYLD